jgi:putative flippase GtrA
MGKDLVGRLAARLTGGMTGQGVRFAAVGSLATLTQLALYAFLSDGLGAQAANVVAWLVSTVVATAAHQHFTFRVAGSAAESDHGFGMATSLAGLGLSSLLLAVLAQPEGVAGTLVLVGVNGFVGVLRFAALRWWLVVRPLARAATLSPTPA